VQSLFILFWNLDLSSVGFFEGAIAVPSAVILLIIELVIVTSLARSHDVDLRDGDRRQA
jgi:hypothetical protein